MEKKGKSEVSETVEERAQKLLEEKEAEARTRSYDGIFGGLLVILLTGWAVFQLYVNTIGVMNAMNLRMWHCMFLLVFTFLLYPTYKRETQEHA